MPKEILAAVAGDAKRMISLRSRFRLTLRAVIAVVCLAGFAAHYSAPAAAIVTHGFSGTCTTDCTQIGLVAGDPVFATFGFIDSSISAGAALGRADLISFALDFGSVEFTITDAHGYDFVGNVAADLSVSIESFIASGLIPSNTSHIVSIDAASWATSIGSCQDATCSSVQSGPTLAGLQVQLVIAPSLPFTVVASPIPEPWSASLFVVGLLFGMVLLRKRRIVRPIG